MNGRSELIKAIIEQECSKLRLVISLLRVQIEVNRAKRASENQVPPVPHQS